MGRQNSVWQNISGHRTSRVGVTLMEVLMSIGVVSIGLLGVVALIPVAGHEARQGVHNDAKALAGKRAFREFAVRGMADPANWFAPGNPTFDPLQIPQAFCIDPVGFRLAEIASQSLNQISQFPSLAAPQVAVAPMQRVMFAPLASAGPPPNFLAVDEVFRIRDDLRFELPAKTVNPATQTLLKDSTGAYAKRDAEERLSWLATLVPEFGALPGSGGSYVLSVAIVAERNAFQPEQQIGVIGFASLNLVTPVTDIQLASAPMGLKSGHWLMLANQGQALGDAQYHWYRVISVTGNLVTVSGPDWKLRSVADSPPSVAIIVPNVVAVYTKTIRLESSAEI